MSEVKSKVWVHLVTRSDPVWGGPEPRERERQLNGASFFKNGFVTKLVLTFMKFKNQLL